jgi:hypothetical protein
MNGINIELRADNIALRKKLAILTLTCRSLRARNNDLEHLLRSQGRGGNRHLRGSDAGNDGLGRGETS